MKRKRQVAMDEELTEVTQESEPEAAPVPVRIIRENGPTVLVEWQMNGNDVARAYVPKEVIQDLHVPADELDAGTSYGVRWESFATISVTAAEVGRQLRRHGIWTRRDLELNVATAQAAFMEACGIDFGALLVAARKQED
jgi:hypothetical protein